MGTGLVWSPDGWARVEAAVSAAAMVLALGALVVAHCRSTGLSPRRSPVSQYALSSAAPLYRIQTRAMAVSAAFLALSLRLCVHRVGIVAVLSALVVFAVARALIGWSPMDAPGAPMTATGRRHGLLAIVAFSSLCIGVTRLHNFQGHYHVLAWWSSTTGVVSDVLWATLLTMFLSRWAPALRRSFGLIERVFYAACVTFFLVSAGAIVSAHP
jgi:hypothetical protein